MECVREDDRGLGFCRTLPWMALLISSGLPHGLLGKREDTVQGTMLLGRSDTVRGDHATREEGHGPGDHATERGEVRLVGDLQGYWLFDAPARRSRLDGKLAPLLRRNDSRQNRSGNSAFPGTSRQLSPLTRTDGGGMEQVMSFFLAGRTTQQFSLFIPIYAVRFNCKNNQS